LKNPNLHIELWYARGTHGREIWPIFLAEIGRGGDLGYTHSGDLNPMEGVSATLQQLTLRIGCKWEPCVCRMPYSLHVRHLAQVGPLNKFDGSGRWLIKWQSFSALSTLPPRCNLISIHKPSKHHLLPAWFITCKTSLKIPKGGNQKP
jgi:hypothetical protein